MSDPLIDLFSTDAAQGLQFEVPAANQLRLGQPTSARSSRPSIRAPPSTRTPPPSRHSAMASRPTGRQATVSRSPGPPPPRRGVATLGKSMATPPDEEDKRLFLPTQPDATPAPLPKLKRTREKPPVATISGDPLTDLFATTPSPEPLLTRPPPSPTKRGSSRRKPTPIPTAESEPEPTLQPEPAPEPEPEPEPEPPVETSATVADWATSTSDEPTEASAPPVTMSIEPSHEADSDQSVVMVDAVDPDEAASQSDAFHAPRAFGQGWSRERGAPTRKA